MAGAGIGALSHALSKVILFGAVGVAEARIGQSVTLDTQRAGGAACRWPARRSSPAALSFIGVPPGFGFVGYWRIYVAATQFGGLALIVALLAVAALDLLCYARAIHRTWLGSPQVQVAGAPAYLAGAGVLASLAVVAVLLGCYPSVLTGAVAPSCWPWRTRRATGMNLFAKLLALSRRKSPWIYTVNSGSCNGCDIEIGPCISPRYDGEQIGMLRQGSPKHADILVVTGTLTRRSRQAVLDIYAQMPSPKAVVAIGSCPASGNVFAGSPVIDGPLDKYIPVDVWVSGCPPRPQLIIAGVAQAAELLAEGQNGGPEEEVEVVLNELARYVFAVLVWPGVLGVGALGFFYLWIARKHDARLQGRRGPPFYQPFFDFVKLLGKQTVVSRGVNPPCSTHCRTWRWPRRCSVWSLFRCRPRSFELVSRRYHAAALPARSAGDLRRAGRLRQPVDLRTGQRDARGGAVARVQFAACSPP